uniref:Uncharacterized protein n=1 Tax=Rhipicephalus appendiculatus TaxID=34631 RepID=A0A131Z3I9_RHIAP
MPEEEDDDAKKKKKHSKGKKGKKGSKGKKGKKGSKGKKGKKGSKGKKGKKGSKGKKGKKSPKKESEGEAPSTEEGGSAASSAGSSPKASPAASTPAAAPAAGGSPKPAAGSAPGAPGAHGAAGPVQPMRMGGYYSEAQSMYDDGYDDDFYVDITCYPPRSRGGSQHQGGYGGYEDPYGYGRWPPPRPMQMPMGMGMWGGGMPTRDVSQQMGPQTTTFPPGSPPMAFKTPSTTVVVNMSGERINRSGSRPMSPVMGMGGMGMGMGMGGMGMGMQGMGGMGMPAVPGNKSPIVMSQPLTGTGLTPQMQQLLLRGMPGYTATVVLILVPNP